VDYPKLETERFVCQSIDLLFQVDLFLYSYEICVVDFPNKVAVDKSIP
jgi:hypothetical protein